MDRTKEEQLLRYLDGDLSAAESDALQKEIATSPELKSKLEELQSIDVFFSKRSKLEMPSKMFTQKVMSGLDAAPTPSVLSPRNGLYLLIGIIVASGILVSLLSNGVFNGLNTTLTVDNPVSNQNLNIPQFNIPFDGKTVIKSIIFVNLALALIMLDRTILRPLFQHRNEAV